MAKTVKNIRTNFIYDLRFNLQRILIIVGCLELQRRRIYNIEHRDINRNTKTNRNRLSVRAFLQCLLGIHVESELGASSCL